MDLNEMKRRLQEMQSKSAEKADEKKKVFWKPSVGKQTIRIVPNKYNKKNPFTELYFYYGIGNNTMLSPTNWGEKDPIAEFAKELRKTSDKENWRLARKLDPKVRIFAPVIVRGEEEQGVRLWQFGKETYMDFLNLADNEDVGDFTDVAVGRDIILTTVGPEVTGTPYNKTSIMPRTKETPVSEDKSYVKSVLDNQPNPIESFRKYSFDEMKQALQSWLTPEGESEEEAPVAERPATNYAVKNAPVKANKAEKFDSLFEDDEDDSDSPF